MKEKQGKGGRRNAQLLGRTDRRAVKQTDRQTDRQTEVHIELVPNYKLAMEKFDTNWMHGSQTQIGCTKNQACDRQTQISHIIDKQKRVK